MFSGKPVRALQWSKTPGILVCLGYYLVFLTACSGDASNSHGWKLGTKLCIYPVPNPTMSGWASFEDSYAKASELHAKVVTFYYKLRDLDDNLKNDESIIKYLVPLAEEYDLELAIEIEAPEPPGVLEDLPDDVNGLDFDSPTFRDRYTSLVSDFLTSVNNYDPNHRLKYLFFGNEIDTYLGNHEDELEKWDSLLADLVDLTRSKCPEVLAGTVVTYHDAFANGHLEWVRSDFGPKSDIIAVTFYPEWMPNGYEPGKLDQQLEDIVQSYGGDWKLALIESGVSADSFKGGSEKRQVDYTEEQLAAIANHSAEFEFASSIFSVFPLNWGTPPFSDWVAGVSVYRGNGTARPVRDVLVNVQTNQ